MKVIYKRGNGRRQRAAAAKMAFDGCGSRWQWQVAVFDGSDGQWEGGGGDR